MHPWRADNTKKIWALRDAGRQMLIFNAGDFDLSGESGSYRVNQVNPKTGEVTTGEIVQGGAKVKLPSAAVVWLVKE
jgi:hypothetical protein